MTKAWLAVATLSSCLFVTACNDDNFVNRGVITAAARFQMLGEQKEDPARLLFDSATGDLWRLQAESGGAQWVRVASGPADARVLTPQEVLGVRSPGTAKP